MNSVFQTAVRFVEQYKWSVIPVRSDGSKAPALKEGEIEQYRQRFPTKNELENWFLNNSNWIGIVAGKLSNLSILDVDGEQGLFLMKQKKISSPVSVRTPSHYLHMYFKYEEGLKNHVRILPETDIRSEGGYVVAPNSPGYNFINPYFNVSSLPSFPVDLLPKKEEGVSRNQTGWLAEALTNLKEGNRDDTFTKIIGRMHFERFSSDDINLLLLPYAESSGFGISALAEKIDHITSSYENKGKKQPKEAETMSIKAFLDKSTDVEWLVYPFFSKPSLGFIVGLPESLKSWLAIDLAIELSRGGMWAGKWQTKRSRVLYIDQERAVSETQRRFKALMAEKGLSKEDLAGQLYVDCSSHRKIDLDVSYEALKNEINQIRPDIIIMDSFVTIHSKSENDRMEIQKVMDRLKLIREQFNCTTVFINHESKAAYQDQVDNIPPSAGRMVGSIGVVAAADSQITVKKLTSNSASVYHTKNSLANKAENFVVTVEDTNKGIRVG